MYPRLSPKYNVLKTKLRSPLKLQNQNKISHNSRFSSQKKKIMKLEEHFSQRNHPQQIKLQQQLLVDERIQQKYQHSYPSQLCPRQLPEKYNHLRGKRRSLQMALLMYQKNSNESFYPLNKHIENQAEKKQSYSCINNDEYPQNKMNNYSLSIMKKNNNKENNLPTRNDNNNGKVKAESQIKLRTHFSNILVENNFAQNSQLNKYKSQFDRELMHAYNFIAKSRGKKSFFKTKIMDNILKSNIDQWDNNNNEEDNENQEFYQNNSKIHLHQYQQQ